MKTSLFLVLCFIGGLLSARPARHPTYEPDGKNAVASQNIFLKAKATAKDQWSDRAPALAINGNATANDHWASDSLPAWHQIELPQEETLGSLRVLPYWTDGRIYGFMVEVSKDGTNWQIVADQRANSINAGAEGFRFNFEPVSCKYVRTTFTRNTANAAGHLVEIEGYAAAQSTEARLIPVSPRVRYARDVRPEIADAATAVKLAGWRGERLTTQILVESPAGFGELTIESPTLTDGAGKTIPVRADIVRYTTADGNLVADILDGTEQTKFKGVVRPIFLTIDLPQDAVGPAIGEVAVRVNGTRLALPITVEVTPLTLPTPDKWSCHLDFWQHPDAVARWHDVPMWSDEHLALLKPTMKRLAEMGQKTITATLIDEAWNEQTYDKFRSMIHITRGKDGTWHYDYSDFDRWVTFAREEVGMKNATVNCYTMIPWSLSFAYYDEASGKMLRPRLQPGSKEYEEFWGPYLTAFTAHLREKGWESITRIAMDERPDHLLKPALAVLKKYAPQLLIVAACDRPSEINSEFVDVSYSYSISERLFPVAESRRAEGKLTTFYVCVYPARPNTFMGSDLAESEWLLPFASACGLDGLLRWAYQSWVENPFVSQDFTSWPSGDTSLIYPGNRSSLRLEALRNGIETFEKIAILKRLAAEQGKPEALAPLEAALKTWTISRGGTAGVHLQDLETLDTALRATESALTK